MIRMLFSQKNPCGILSAIRGDEIYRGRSTGNRSGIVQRSWHFFTESNIPLGYATARTQHRRTHAGVQKRLKAEKIEYEG